MSMRNILNILNEAGEYDAEHSEALSKTGFWGKQGAGCIFMAKTTGRFLISHRSAYVEQPNTWGTWGGAIDGDETPENAVKREAYEETGYQGNIHIIPLYVFQKDSFRYSNFLLVVDDEFTPRLDWENQGFKWCEFGNWPKPLHFGLVSLLKDASSISKMKEALKNIKIQESHETPSNSVSEIFHKIVKEIPNLKVKADHREMSKSNDEYTRAMAEHSFQAYYGNERAEVIVETDGSHIYGFYENFYSGEKKSIRYGHDGVTLRTFVDTVRGWIINSVSVQKVSESIDDDKPLTGTLDPKKLAEMLPEVTDVPKFTTAIQKIKRGDAEKLTLAEKGQLALAFVSILKGDKDEKTKFIRRLINVKVKE